MQIIGKLLLAGISISAALVAAGCQSDAQSRENGGPTTNPMTASVSCDKCHTLYTRSRTLRSSPRARPHIFVYRTASNHECDECRTAVKDYFSQDETKRPGDTVHQCKSCGGSLKACHEAEL